MAHKHQPLSRAQTLALIARVPSVHLALPGPDAPVLRPMHVVVHDDVLWFHGHLSPSRAAAVGQRASVAAHEVIARLPSHFFHAENACPATTWFCSAVVEGEVIAAQDNAHKAQILQALMERHQPEGGYVPLSASRPGYAGVLSGLAVWGVRPDRISGRIKAGFHLPPERLQHVLRQLWARGGPQDVAAIDQIRDWNPALPDPDFLGAPARLRLCPTADHAAQCADLLADAYWNQGVPWASLRTAHLGSTAWVVAEQDGAVVASARALSDGAKFAWIYDVIVAEPWRGRGLGRALLRVLFDHPAVRGARRVMLATRDAMAFYARLGFVTRDSVPPRPYTSVDMVWDR